MAPPVALITGASSGIGLALTKHLLAQKWAVAMVDVNPPKEELPNTIFLRTDISSWDQQAATFQQAFTWHSRLDFCALNAGIDDRDDIFSSLSNTSTKPPKQPNMATINVSLIGTYYGLKLAAHYLTLPVGDSGKPQPGGKVVITASAAGIYPLPSVPQYAATKHALVGLVRSIGGGPASAVNIRINALCPALVATGLAPPGLMSNFSAEQITPMSTMMRAFDELADLSRIEEADWVEKGRTGEVVEGSLEDLIWHPAPARPKASSYVDERGLEAWAKAYTERNRNFAMMEWMDVKK